MASDSPRRPPRRAAGLLDGLKAVPAPEAEDGLFSTRWLFDNAVGLRPLAGLDEAGRGPLAGPLVAAAVILPRDFDSPAIDDSKKLSEEKRESAYSLITSAASSWAVSIKSAADVDALNPLGAALAAMAEAFARLDPRPVFALVDGNKLPVLPVRARPVVSGDALSLCVAAASIVAKVTRDRLMVEAHALYPEYRFDQHKGYGTREHLILIKRHGACPIHRLTFRGTVPPPPSPRLFE
jgi:ribonuclease HII